MKITKEQLKKIIKEELEEALSSDYHSLMKAKKKAFQTANEDCEEMKNHWTDEQEVALRAADEAKGGRLVGRRHAEPCRDYGLKD